MTTIQMRDAFVLDGVRKTQDGYLTAFARVARTGVQTYRGSELGRPDLDTVRVYRPPAEVFHEDAMRSLAHRPVTLRHPSTPVTARNWKQHARGQTGEDVVRDGDFVKVPLVLMDAAIIDAYERQGIKELSVGYSTDIKWTHGVVADGEPDAGQEYDAVQTAIRGNHLAVVPVARGGDQLRIGDEEEDVEDAWSEEARQAALEARRAKAKGGGSDHENMEPHEMDNKTLRAARKALERVRRDAEESGIKTPGMRRRIEKLHSVIAEMRKRKIDDAFVADGTCPECGAEMTGKTCPECNYVKDNGEQTMKMLTLDGFTVQVADDNHASIITRVVDGLRTELKTVTDSFEDFKKKAKKDEDEKDKAVKDAQTAVSAKDGEIAVLKQQLKDAEITPAKLDALVKDRQTVFDAAARVLPREYVFDGRTIAEVKRAAVEHKLGDAAKGMDDAAIGGAFQALTAGAVNDGGTRPIVDAFQARRPSTQGGSTQVADAAYEESVKALGDRWKGAAA